MRNPVVAHAAILQALRLGDGHGTELIGRAAQITGGQVVLNQGSVYPALARLRRSGYVELVRVEPSDTNGGRPRQVHRLTDSRLAVAEKHSRAVLALFGPQF